MNFIIWSLDITKSLSNPFTFQRKVEIFKLDKRFKEKRSSRALPLSEIKFEILNANLILEIRVNKISSY